MVISDCVDESSPSVPSSPSCYAPTEPISTTDSGLDYTTDASGNCPDVYDPWCACRVPGDCDQHENYCFFSEALNNGRKYRISFIENTKTNLKNIVFFL